MNLDNMGQTLRLREYFYMAIRHKTVFFITALVSLVVSLGITFRMPKIYRSETILMVQDEKILNPLISGLAIAPSVASRMRTLRDELLSWPRMTLLVEKLNLSKKRTPIEQEKLIKGMVMSQIFTPVSFWLGNHPWKIIVPLSIILTLIFHFTLGKPYDDFILKLFGKI